MSRIGWYRLWIFLMGPILLGACAFGNRHAYHTVTADLTTSGPGRISVATYDQRPYVLQKEKGPHFVGISRGGYGNPFDVGTEDDLPLADAMTRAISNSLQKKGFEPVPVFVPPSESSESIRKMLLQSQVDRAILLTLREWKSDTHIDSSLLYDVTLNVLDRTGRVIGEKRVQGRDNLGMDFWNPPAHAREAVSKAFKAKLEELLNEPAVANALRPLP
jgi:hypothetical protein